jgi:putative tryptophan/tyrosine transport system substrate-binding protein
VPESNVVIEYRWAQGHYDRLPGLAKELVGLHLSALAAPGGALSGLAAKASTSTVPVIFLTADDPVRVGLVDSLNRPGGNVTGVSFFSAELGDKRAQLLCELAPAAKTIALLVNSKNQLAPACKQGI